MHVLITSACRNNQIKEKVGLEVGLDTHTHTHTETERDRERERERDIYIYIYHIIICTLKNTHGQRAAVCMRAHR